MFRQATALAFLFSALLSHGAGNSPAHTITPVVAQPNNIHAEDILAVPNNYTKEPDVSESLAEPVQLPPNYKHDKAVFSDINASRDETFAVNQNDVDLAKRFASVSAADDCRKLPVNVRNLFFSQFLHELARPGAEADAVKKRIAHLMGMVPYESDSNSANVTDMSYKSNGSKGAVIEQDGGNRSKKASLNALLSALDSNNIAMTSQTNFGLLQMSPNRFSLRSKTSIQAVKDLIARAGGDSPSQLMNACGTDVAFRTKDKDDILKQFAQMTGDLPAAVEGRWKRNVAGNNVEEIKKVGKWLALCPSLNLEIASFEYAASPSLPYFSTKNKAPICQKELDQVEKNKESFKEAAPKD